MACRTSVKDRVLAARENKKKYLEKGPYETAEKGFYLSLLFDYKSGRLVDEGRIKIFKKLEKKYGAKN